MLGIISGTQAVVQRGLRPGDRVVTSGALRLTAGAAVQVADPVRPPAEALPPRRRRPQQPQGGAPPGPPPGPALHPAAKNFGRQAAGRTKVTDAMSRSESSPPSPSSKRKLLIGALAVAS